MNPRCIDLFARLTLTLQFPRDGNDDVTIDAADIPPFTQTIDNEPGGADLNIEGQTDFFGVLFHLVRVEL